MTIKGHIGLFTKPSKLAISKFYKGLRMTGKRQIFDLETSTDTDNGRQLGISESRDLGI